MHVSTPLADPEAEAGPYEPAAELLKALGHPVRIAVVRALSAGPLCVHELVEIAHISQPLLSQHLRVLRGAALVRGSRRGKEVAYRLTDQHIGHLVADAVRHAHERLPAPAGAAAPAGRAAPPTHTWTGDA